MQKDLLKTYDFDLPLHDAVADPSLSPTRRMLALSAMGRGLDDAHLSAMQLFEAVEQVAADWRARSGPGEGEADVAAILAAEGDDFQRRLFYIVSDNEVYNAISDLGWLVQLTKARARMFPLIREAGAPMPTVPVAEPVAASLRALLRQR